MKQFSLLAIAFLTTCFSFGQSKDNTEFIDPFIGTGGHGHTYPGAVMPHGMVQLSPDTRDDGSWDGCSGYHYSDSNIFGFSHTHLSGTGCSDYGDILMMPVPDSVDLQKKYSAKFQHANEKASVGYYSVKFNNGINAELSATTRVGIHKYSFPYGCKPAVLLDLIHRDKVLEGHLKVINKTTVEGFRRSEAWARNQVVYFRIEFAKPFESVEVNSDSTKTDAYNHPTDYYGKIRALFSFKLQPGEALMAKVSISGVDEEGAEKNMKAELPGWDFEKVKKDAHDAWLKEISKIEVHGGTPERMKIFLTALYHCMVVPNIYNDVDGRYRGRDFQIHKAEGFNYYSVFSLWDTFRAWHPLMTIIDRQRTLDYIKTFLAQYEQGGLLPVWELSSNETECMIGYHSISVIADAAMKGIKGFDMEKAFEAMKKSAESRKRYGLGAYIDQGFLSMDDESENVSKTLEYAYDDWCIAQMAQLLHHDKDYMTYMERSQSWKNLFDKQAGFIRPRKNGDWYKPFDPREVNNNYTEANAWQYNFFVPQEIKSFVDMNGGADKFEKKLDELFTTNSKTTGRDQDDISGMIGQYAHGNEPSHHMAYLYNYIGKPWETQERVHQILEDFYHPAPDGLIGNEDCGQMSAWYVMSAMGLYQVCPGNPVYDVVPPLFSKTIIHLENGKTVSIKVNVPVSKISYIKKIHINDNSFEGTVIPSSAIDSGAAIVYEMGIGNSLTDKIDHYAGLSAAKPICKTPVITSASASASFKGVDSLMISSANWDDMVYYTVDGTDPSPKSGKYARNFREVVIDSSCTVKAVAINAAGVASKIVTARFFKVPHPDWKISIASKYNPQYTAGGDGGLIDGIRGDVNWRKGEWQGYQSQDFEAVIDMGAEQTVAKLTAGFLQDTRAWILMPKKVTFELSVDGKEFSKAAEIINAVPDSDLTVQTKDFTAELKDGEHRARFVKVKAENYGKLPPWHQGYPYKGEAFIFIDEIKVD